MIHPHGMKHTPGSLQGGFKLTNWPTRLELDTLVIMIALIASIIL